MFSGRQRDIEPILQDLTYLDWTEHITSSALGGSYLKARSGTGAESLYYKLSCYDEVNGIYGHECVNEIIAARLMDVLCIEHVPYRLVHALVNVGGKTHETWLSESPSFRGKGESKTTLARFYDWNHLAGETRLAFCARFGWMRMVRSMMLVDYLIGNRDRHGGNVEVLKGKTGVLRLAPLFDNGLSLCFSTYDGATLAKIDPLQDIVSNNYLGTRSLEENVRRFVPADLPVGQLLETHGGYITQGLAPAVELSVDGISGQGFLDYLWAMIWGRWCTYANLRDSGFLKAQG